MGELLDVAKRYGSLTMGSDGSTDTADPSHTPDASGPPNTHHSSAAGGGATTAASAGAAAGESCVGKDPVTSVPIALRILAPCCNALLNLSSHVAIQVSHLAWGVGQCHYRWG